jgi:hypothetical protein
VNEHIRREVPLAGEVTDNKVYVAAPDTDYVSYHTFEFDHFTGKVLAMQWQTARKSESEATDWAVTVANGLAVSLARGECTNVSQCIFAGKAG